jgi:membrane-associated phospholipid phosphatase
MTKPLLAFTCACACLLTSAPATASPHDWDRASSVGRTGLVAVAFGLPVIRGDWRGAEQAGLAMGSTSLLTYGLKKAIPETRPDGSDRESFPSGHTSVSFAAAATLEKRYGWQAGIPAFAVASFVGLARVEAKKHFAGDVLAGAAIGSAGGWLLTSRHDSRVQWMPWGDAHGGGGEVVLRF